LQVHKAKGEGYKSLPDQESRWPSKALKRTCIWQVSRGKRYQSAQEKRMVLHGCFLRFCALGAHIHYRCRVCRCHNGLVSCVAPLMRRKARAKVESQDFANVGEMHFVIGRFRDTPKRPQQRIIKS
jgi:hypothetical protein